MSHITSIELEVKDLNALKSACRRLGFVYRENQRQFEYYKNQKGECLHAIHIEGCQYEVGIQRNANEGYQLAWDNYHQGGLVAALGEGAGKLKQFYGLEKVKIEARKKGYSVTERMKENGQIVLTMTR